MDINKNLRKNKVGLLSYFRSRANEILSELALVYSAADYRKKASALNKAMIQSRDNLLDILNDKARSEIWTSSEILECVLMITYTNIILQLCKIQACGRLFVEQTHTRRFISSLVLTYTLG